MRINTFVTGGGVLTAVVVVGLLLTPGPRISAADPPATMSLTGTIRDFRPDANHPDFTISGSTAQGPYCKNVALALTDNKPVFVGNGQRVSNHWRDADNRQISWCHFSDTITGDSKGKFQNGTNSGGITSASSFAQWFRDVPGINLSRLWTIALTWGNDSQFGQCWMYDTNNFNPIDNQLQGNDFDEKNFFFTYEIVAKFTYNHAANQFFYYKGDDDCWIFITSGDGSVNQMVMDHGGVAGSREQMVHIKNNRPGLAGLVDGQEYQLRWFIAERKQPQSQFHVKTNVQFSTTQASDAVLAAYD